MAAHHQFFQHALENIGKLSQAGHRSRLDHSTSGADTSIRSSRKAGPGSEESRMKHWAILLLPLLLVGCAGTPLAPQRVEGLFQDQAFAPASERINANDIFALSAEMRRYLKVEIADQIRVGGPQRGLVEALYSKTQLKLEYDSEL